MRDVASVTSSLTVRVRLASCWWWINGCAPFLSSNRSIGHGGRGRGRPPPPPRWLDRKFAVTLPDNAQYIYFQCNFLLKARKILVHKKTGAMTTKLMAHWENAKKDNTLVTVQLKPPLFYRAIFRLVARS